MDKNTLTKYGAIVVVVIIIAILIGITYPGIMFIRDIFFDHVDKITDKLPEDFETKEPAEISITGVYSTLFNYFIDGENFDTVIIYINDEVVLTTTEAVEGMNTYSYDEGTLKSGDLIVVELYKDEELISWDSEEYTYITAYALVLSDANADDLYNMVFVTSDEVIEAGDTYNSKSFGNGLTVAAAYTGFDAVKYKWYSSVPWYNYATSIQKVAVESDGIAPVSTAYWFNDFWTCTAMDLKLLDTSNVTSMTYMFGNNLALTDVDVSGFNLARVETTSHMFETCRALPSLDVSKWNVSNVSDMSYMFRNCNAINTLDLSKWNVGNVKNMECMFLECWAISALNINNWNVSNVSSMNSMFSACKGLTEINLSKWNTKSLTDAGSLFSNCNSLGYINLSNWDTSNTTKMNMMFFKAGYDASSFVIEGLNNWNTKSVKNFSCMFQESGRNAATWSIGDLTNWNVSNSQNFANMFFGAGFTTTGTWSIGNIGGWDTSSVVYMTYMFANSGPNSSEWIIGDISGWNTSSVEELDYMFYFAGSDDGYLCDLSEWDVGNVRSHAEFSTGTIGITPPNWEN